MPRSRFSRLPGLRRKLRDELHGESHDRVQEELYNAFYDEPHDEFQNDPHEELHGDLRDEFKEELHADLHDEFKEELHADLHDEFKDELHEFKGELHDHLHEFNDELHADLHEFNDKIHGDLHEFKDELHGDLHEFKDELHGDLHEFKDELHGDLHEFTDELHEDRHNKVLRGCTMNRTMRFQDKLHEHRYDDFEDELHDTRYDEVRSESEEDSGAVFTIGRSRFADNVASHFFIRKDPVVSITCGDEHSAVICQSGRLFVFGSNGWGQLGLGHKNHVSKPSCVKILKPEKVTHVACGRAHTLICTGSQKIFACGSDQEGQLGRGSSAIGDSASTPVLVYDCGLAGPRIVDLAAGSHHSVALTSDGGVVAWGSNLEGQLGLSGISGLVNKPTKVHIPEPVKEISAGYYHSAFLTENGLVYVCGESESGKLGIDVNFSTQVAPKQVQLPNPAVNVVCGGHHTLILTDSGSLYCTGSNASGQLGMGTKVTEVQTPKMLSINELHDEGIAKIACGESHSAILTESGKLFTCGDGRHGKLGLEENENNVHEFTFAIKYQELFITNVACGGCHTILVGRRHDFDNHAQMETVQMDHHHQKKNPLPPLKLPVNRLHGEGHEESANEARKTEADIENSNVEPSSIEDNREHVSSTRATIEDASNNNEPRQAAEKTEEEKSDELPTDTATKQRPESTERQQTEEKPKSETTNSSEETKNVEERDNQRLEEKEEAKVEDERIENDDKSRPSSSSSKRNRRNNEGMENEADVENLKTEEETRTKTDPSSIEEEEEARKEEKSPMKEENKMEKRGSSSGSTPPPKPPRLKPGSASDSSTDMRASSGDKREEGTKENTLSQSSNEQNDAESKEKDEDMAKRTESSSGKSSTNASSKSRAETVETIEADKQNISEEVDGKEKRAEGEHDDADVVQSPAPRTGKMAKLFKAKRQQEIENGTKTANSTIHKTKSRACVIL
ncbi:hypothetical protein KM043_014704 [Ampulex compressa]|nr:hypothetical protein KM043_014704 [Ampulex compressa]